MFKSFIKISKIEVMNQNITKIIDKLLNFLTLKGCMHFKGENFNNINKIKNTKLKFWLVPKI